MSNEKEKERVKYNTIKVALTHINDVREKQKVSPLHLLLILYINYERKKATH